MSFTSDRNGARYSGEDWRRVPLVSIRGTPSEVTGKEDTCAIVTMTQVDGQNGSTVRDQSELHIMTPKKKQEESSQCSSGKSLSRHM